MGRIGRLASSVSPALLRRDGRNHLEKGTTTRRGTPDLGELYNVCGLRWEPACIEREPFLHTHWKWLTICRRRFLLSSINGPKEFQDCSGIFEVAW